MKPLSGQIKITAVQLEILQRLADGEMLIFNKYNQLCLPTPLTGRISGEIASTTRTFLMKNKLIERLDKSHDSKNKGNGFIISSHGKEILDLTKRMI